MAIGLVVGTKLPSGLRDALKRQAEAERRTVSQLIRLMVEEGLTRRGVDIRDVGAVESAPSGEVEEPRQEVQES